MISISWAAVFLVESLGAALNFRRSRLLFAFLTFASLSEPITFAILRYYPHSYCSAWWTVDGIQNLMLIGLGARLCGMFVAEKDKLKAIMGTAAVYLVVIAFVADLMFTSDTLKDRLLNGEMAANGMLLATLFVYWMNRRNYLTRGWKVIAFGLMAWIAGSLFITALCFKWTGAATWYMAGEAPALLIWTVPPLLEAYRERKGRIRIAALAACEMAGKLTKRQKYALSEETRGWITENVKAKKAAQKVQVI